MDWVTAAATFVTAVATAVLAVFTWPLWRSTRLMAAATSEASVVAALEASRASFIYLELVIENTGAGPAYDVQIAFEPPLTRVSKDPLSTGAAPINCVSLLRPSQVLRDYLGPAANYLGTRYRVSVFWKGSPAARRRTTNAYDLDISHFDRMLRPDGGEPLVEMGREVKKLREIVDRWSQISRRLGVDIYTERDRAREREEEEQWVAEAGAQLEALKRPPEGPEGAS